MTAVETLRQAAVVVREFGPIHGWIADGLLSDADEIEAGNIAAEDVPESMNLARTYLGQDV